MKHRFTTPLIALTAVTMLLLGAGQALASTPAGETISNLATLDYEVNNTTQPQLQSGGGTSTDFTVDLLVNPLVVRQSAATVSVTPGENDALHTFRVDNLGNDIATDGTDQYFRLTIGTPTDDLGVTSVLADIDTDNDGTFEQTDVDISAGVTVQIDTEAYITVVLKADVPNTATDNETTVYDLIATAVDNSDNPLSASTSASLGIDTVFADLASTATAPGATDNDGRDSDRGTFQVSAADFNITKSESVAGGYYLPGAVVTYDIELTNNGSAAADSVVVTDAIPTNTTYNSFLADDCNGTRAWHEDTTANGLGDTWQATEPTTKGNVKAVRCTIVTISGDSGSGGGTEVVSFTITID